MNVYLAAALGAVVVTSLELAFRNQRHPFGDVRMKALGWWVVIAGLDSLLAAAALFGVVAFATPDPATPAGRSELVSALVVGVFGPLALRSPVRKSEVAGQEVGVGVTYIYDLARVEALRALDERMARLRRIDVERLRISWARAGVSPSQIQKAIEVHLASHERLDPDARELILEGVGVCQSIPGSDEKIEAYIKLLRKHRLGSLIDDLGQSAS